MHKFALHSPLRSWKKDEMQVSPFVSLAVGSYSEDEEGRLLLTSQLMTETEIDQEVDELTQELEEFRRVAKKELKTLQAKMLEK